MADETYSSDGPYDVSDPELAAALDRAARRAEQAELERERAECEPGFFVAPDRFFD
ncbi:MAG TPA: hypothetical protein VF164_11785 [Trueperaceae bacterium]